MHATTRTSFDVSDVKRGTELLPEIPYKQAVEAPLAAGPVEACSRYHGRLLDEVAYHPVVASVHRAFMNHRPLCLTPDAIWLLACQGVANHINVHAEELRPRIVAHIGKLQIGVRRDDFVKGSPENPWEEVFHEFSAQIRAYVGEGIDLFVPRFSTTGPVERAAAEVVLLDAMQSFFEYRVHSCCGIPAITLEGTTEDWEGLAERVQGFREFGLGPWVEVLAPILDQFARASRGDVDPSFWRSLYKFESVSGGAKINGWLTAFFPYGKDHGTGLTSVPSRVLGGGDRARLEELLYPGGKRDWRAPGVSADFFPCGLSRAPFRWDYLKRSFDMEFLGGFVGVAQDPETLELRPEIGWAVREAPQAG